MEKEMKMKMFEDIKQRLSNCENDTCEFDDLFLDMEDGSRLRCKFATVKNDGVSLVLDTPDGLTIKLMGECLLQVKQPDAIFNAIHWESVESELIQEIEMKIAHQPELPYVFKKPFEVEMTDGNKFLCNQLDYLDEDCDTINVTLWAEYTGDIEIPLDGDFLSVTALEAISEEIMPPRTIYVDAQYKVGENATDDFRLHEKDVPYSFTEEQLLGYLKENFPTFDWQHDEENQYVYYPDEDNHDNYILATCYKD